MARKKNGSSSAVVVAATGLMLFALTAPLLAIFAWIYFEIRCRKLPRRASLEAFAHDASESKQLSALLIKLRRSRAQYAKLESDGCALPRRKDGAFDGRNALGRELNNKFAALIPKLQGEEAEAVMLQELPLRRFKSWSFDMSGRYATRAAILTYIILASTLYLVAPEWVQGLSEPVSRGSLIKIFPEDSILYGVTICAAAFAFLATPPIWLIRKNQLEVEFDGYRTFVAMCSRQ